MGNAASLVGQRYRIDDYYEVGREKVREFSRAVQDYHPGRWEGHRGLVAPLTFSAVMGSMAQRALFGPVIQGYDLSQVLQIDQTVEMAQSIVSGDRLHCDTYFESARQFQGNDFITVRNTITNQRNELVVVASSTFVARDVETDEKMRNTVAGIMSQLWSVEPGQTGGVTVTRLDAEADFITVDPPKPQTRPGFESVAVGDELPARTLAVTRGDLVNYTGVSGDPNPIHHSDHVAELVGLRTCVAQGMLTMGLGSSYLTEWLDDPAAIVKYSVRFGGIAEVEPDRACHIDYRARVKALDPETRTATIALTGTANGKKLFGRALAQVRLS